MTTLICRLGVLISALMAGSQAWAGAPPPTPIPEPGTWALIGLAAAIGWGVTRNRRK